MRSSQVSVDCLRHSSEDLKHEDHQRRRCPMHVNDQPDDAATPAAPNHPNQGGGRQPAPASMPCWARTINGRRQIMRKCCNNCKHFRLYQETKVTECHRRSPVLVERDMQDSCGQLKRVNYTAWPAVLPGQSCGEFEEHITPAAPNTEVDAPSGATAKRR